MTDLDKIIEQSKLAQNIEDIAKTILIDRGGVKDLCLSKEMSDKYNVGKTSYLGVVLQGFYEMGLKAK